MTWAEAEETLFTADALTCHSKEIVLITNGQLGFVRVSWEDATVSTNLKV